MIFPSLLTTISNDVTLINNKNTSEILNVQEMISCVIHTINRTITMLNEPAEPTGPVGPAG